MRGLRLLRSPIRVTKVGCVISSQAAVVAPPTVNTPNAWNTPNHWKERSRQERRGFYVWGCEWSQQSCVRKPKSRRRVGSEAVASESRQAEFLVRDWRQTLLLPFCLVLLVVTSTLRIMDFPSPCNDPSRSPKVCGTNHPKALQWIWGFPKLMVPFWGSP